MTTPDYTIEQKWAWVRNAALGLYQANSQAKPVAYMATQSTFLYGAIPAYCGEPPIPIEYTHQRAVYDALELWRAVEEARDHE